MSSSSSSAPQKACANEVDGSVPAVSLAEPASSLPSSPSSDPAEARKRKIARVYEEKHAAADAKSEEEAAKFWFPIITGLELGSEAWTDEDQKVANGVITQVKSGDALNIFRATLKLQDGCGTRGVYEVLSGLVGTIEAQRAEINRLTVERAVVNKEQSI